MYFENKAIGKIKATLAIIFLVLLTLGLTLPETAWARTNAHKSTVLASLENIPESSHEATVEEAETHEIEEHETEEHETEEHEVEETKVHEPHEIKGTEIHEPEAEEHGEEEHEMAEPTGGLLSLGDIALAAAISVLIVLAWKILEQYGKRVKVRG
ncbi:MAG: hypothetical protein QMD08_01060 [Actinomycetota bacterium]|nr:hypothetical protein [Actinomycetota bacterium]